MANSTAMSFHPLTPDYWVDFERLFGPRGACAGCWCTFWKLRGKAFEENTGEPARLRQKAWVESGLVPGLLAFQRNVPVGWIAVEPRSAYPKLAHSRVLKPVDESDPWSITCFFVSKQVRRHGLSVELLKAAVAYVRSEGGKILEGYPVAAEGDLPDVFVYHGTAAAFRKAGFVEVARRSKTRPIMRYFVGD